MTADLYQMLGLSPWSERGHHAARAIGGFVFVVEHDDVYSNDRFYSINHQSTNGKSWQSDPIGSRALAEESAALLGAFCGAEVVRS